MHPAQQYAWTRRQSPDILAMKNPAVELRNYFVPCPRSSNLRDKFAFSHGPEYDDACRKAWRQRLKQDSAAYQYAPETIKSDPDAVLSGYFGALRRTWASLERANEQLAQNRIMIAEAVESDWWLLNDAGIGLREDRQYVFNITQVDMVTQWKYSANIANKTEMQLVQNLQKLKQDLLEFRDVSTKTRWDREDRLRALDLDFERWKKQTRDMPLDQKLVLGKKHWDRLIKMSEQLVDDRGILFDAVTKFSPILQTAMNLLRSDRKILLRAVQQFWSSKKAAEQIGTEKREVVLQTVMQDWKILEQLTRSIAQNQELMLNAVNRDWQVLEDAADVIRTDRELIHEAMIQWSGSWRRRAPTKEEIANALSAEHTVEHADDKRLVKFEEAFKTAVVTKRAARDKGKQVVNLKDLKVNLFSDDFLKYAAH